jgi:hypothetical protein
MILHATEARSIYAIAYAMGYKPKLSVPSIVDLDVYQLFPASGSGASITADTRYSMILEPGARVRSSTNGTEFYIADRIDFSINNTFDPLSVSVYSLDSNGAPNYYLGKKTVKAISAVPKTVEIEVGNVTKFFKFLVQDTNLVAIDSIVDADGNIWTEVPYLAQDTVFEKVVNTAYNDPDAAVYSQETPYLLKLKRVPRRFVTRITEKGIEVQFGAGVSSNPDEELLATPENIGVALPTGKDDIDWSIDPASPVFTTAYGIAPSNTTLTVTYLVGGGISSNVPTNTITDLVGVSINSGSFPTGNGQLTATVVGSIAINNPTAAIGGRSGETLDEVRQNALAQLTSQNRAVTREDYTIRAYAMPNVYGSVAKVFITPDEQNNITTDDYSDKVANPLAMNMYVLGYDLNKNIVSVNRAVKENLRTYLSQYRMLTDSINIRDGYVVNIGIDFSIVPLPSYNANQVLLGCVNALKDYFDIDRWQMNQPIVIGDIFNTILAVDGVQTVPSVIIKNLYDEVQGYSNIAYGIQEATRNGIVYPSLDPMIFEIKYPNNDIKGRIATF